MTPVELEIGSVDRVFAGKYLMFKSNDESYAGDVIRVREIIRLTGITAVAGQNKHPAIEPDFWKTQPLNT